MEELSDDEEGRLESDVDESGQENVIPASDAIDRAVAAEEAMMEMTAMDPTEQSCHSTYSTFETANS